MLMKYYGLGCATYIILLTNSPWRSARRVIYQLIRQIALDPIARRRSEPTRWRSPCKSGLTSLQRLPCTWKRQPTTWARRWSVCTSWSPTWNLTKSHTTMIVEPNRNTDVVRYLTWALIVFFRFQTHGNRYVSAKARVQVGYFFGRSKLAYNPFHRSYFAFFHVFHVF